MLLVLRINNNSLIIKKQKQPQTSLNIRLVFLDMLRNQANSFFYIELNLILQQRPIWLWVLKLKAKRHKR